jgi:RHS repeat-associated protein
VIARHNYLPFGEEISSGVGLRTSGQGYGATDTNRQKYALTERDDATGLDHTWWRKYESFSGRWTSPDPYANSAGIADPQSFNRYSYTENDPVNSVDPTGLLTMMECTLVGTMVINDRRVPIFLCRLIVWAEFPIVPLDPGLWKGKQKPKKKKPAPQKTAGSSENEKKACEAKRQLEKCVGDARQKFFNDRSGPSAEFSKDDLPTREDLSLSGEGGGITALLRLLGGATLGTAAASGGETIAIGLGLISVHKIYKNARRAGDAMQRAYDEEQKTIEKCHADFEKAVREAGYDPQDVLTKQKWNDCR